MATLIKIDKNGSKHYEGLVKCDRCGGQGSWIGWRATGMTCWKCGGTGQMFSKWIERTPEYQAKLDARREARQEKKLAEARAKWEAEEALRQAELEAKRIANEAEEARIKAQKAISQHVGQIGEKLDLEVTFDHTAWFECAAFHGFGTEIRYIHTFKDDAGNVLIWKTSTGLGDINPQEGERVRLRGAVKEHNEYKDEKQTVLTRCKVSK